MGDTMTCLIKNVDKCRRSYPNSYLLPVILGVVHMHGAATFQMLDRRSRGIEHKSFLARPGSGVTRGVVLCLLYWYFGRGFRGGKYRNVTMFIMTVAYTILELCEDSFKFDAFANVHKPILAFL